MERGVFRFRLPASWKCVAQAAENLSCDESHFACNIQTEVGYGPIAALNLRVVHLRRIAVGLPHPERILFSLSLSRNSVNPNIRKVEEPARWDDEGDPGPLKASPSRGAIQVK